MLSFSVVSDSVIHGLWRKAWQPTAVFLHGESYGQKSLEGYGPLGHKESDTTIVSERGL